MDKEQLRGQLEQLHAELQKVESLDAHERELLLNLARDVQDLLDREGDDTEPYRGLGGRLSEAVAQLEAAHPRTTMLMRQVIDQLAYLGI